VAAEELVRKERFENERVLKRHDMDIVSQDCLNRRSLGDTTSVHITHHLPGDIMSRLNLAHFGRSHSRFLPTMQARETHGNRYWRSPARGAEVETRQEPIAATGLYQYVTRYFLEETATERYPARWDTVPMLGAMVPLS
jgi:hypothetical protein